MTVYVYRCGVCGEEDEEAFPIGTARKMRRCTCGGVQRQVLGVGVAIAAAALPNKGRAVTAINDRERRWQKDMPAYKQLRSHGLQPGQIDGADRLAATATDRLDVEHASVLERVEKAYDIPRSESKPRMQEALATIEQHPVIAK